ncbi:MAG: GNAT superfamily N-acetyltransferase [Verrucomicrobiales bacterium]|jgi:GNAT superfamily N-acetyltransferase
MDEMQFPSSNPNECVTVFSDVGQWHLLETWELERLTRFIHGKTSSRRRGSILVTYFDQVEYFRRIHGLTSRTCGAWPDVLGFFRQFGQSFLVDLHPDDKPFIQGLASWGNHDFCYRTVRMSCPIDDLTVDPAYSEIANEVNVVSVDRQNISAFSEIYLNCFRACSTPFMVARDNLNALLGMAGWRPYLVRIAGKYAGCYSSFCRDDEVLLSSAATLPRYRNLGLQKLMISRRLDDARKEGVVRAIAQTVAGSVSADNLKKTGFRDACELVTYRLRTS